MVEAETPQIKPSNNKFKQLLKDRYFQLFLVIFSLAVILRLYYFLQTLNQPLWWDESEYMALAKHFAGYNQWITGVRWSREAAVSFIWSIFLRINSSEIFPRIIQFLASVSIVPVSYLLGTELYSKRIGIYAAVFSSVFWIYLFHSYRLHLYLWAPVVYGLALLLFYKAYNRNDKRLMSLSFAIGFFGLSIYYSIVFSIIVFLIFLLLVERVSVIKNKNYWLSAAIGLICLIPYFAYSYLATGKFVPRLGQQLSASISEGGIFHASKLSTYFIMMPSQLYLALFILFLIGAVTLFLTIFLGHDLIKTDKKVRADLFVLLSWLTPVLILSIVGSIGLGHAFWSEFMMAAFPAMLIISAVGLSEIEKNVSRISNSKMLGLAVVIIFFLLVAFQNVLSAGSLIDAKKESYSEIRDAGMWIKEHSEDRDIIVSKSVPQITYYSNRYVYNLADDKSQFDSELEKYHPRFMVLSTYESHPKWVQQYIGNNTDWRVVQTYTQQSQPVVIIYEYAGKLNNMAVNINNTLRLNI